MSSIKSRNLSIFDYIEILQEEYICFDIRSKIYRFKIHKDYWNLVKEGKKKSILEICKRNSLPSIFTSPIELERIGKKIFIGLPYPNFSYKDEKFRNQWEHWDEKNYFNRDANVKIEISEGAMLYGSIVKYDYVTKKVVVRIREEDVIREVNKEQVTRIL